jgi:hypothetical protein
LSFPERQYGAGGFPTSGMTLPNICNWTSPLGKNAFGNGRPEGTSFG